MHRWAAMLVVVVLATGCSDSGSSEPSVAAPTTRAAGDPISGDASSATSLPSVDYGRQYLDLVTPSNCEGQRVAEIIDALDTGGGDPPWGAVEEQLLPAFEEYSRSLISFYEGLAAASWPPDAQPIVNELIDEMVALARWTADASRATSFDDLASVSEPPVPGSAASRLRAELGLPSNIFDDTDPCAEAPV